MKIWEKEKAEAKVEARVEVEIILAPLVDLQERVAGTLLGDSWDLSHYFQATVRSRGGGVCLVPAGTRSASGGSEMNERDILLYAAGVVTPILLRYLIRYVKAYRKEAKRKKGEEDQRRE